MDIPVRCFTCGGLLSDKWIKYESLHEYVTATECKDADIFQLLGVERVCCKRHFLCAVNVHRNF